MKNFKPLFSLILKISFSVLAVTLFYSSCGKSSFTSESSSILENIDPLQKYAWHLFNTGQFVFASTSATVGVDLNLSQTWSDKIYGNGIHVQISDDGLEDTHEDLNANFPYLNQSKNYVEASPYVVATAPPQTSDDNHGTCVSGLVAAEGWNGKGSRGVAPKAHLTIANFLSSAVTQSTAKEIDQASGSFDISNMSWGNTQDFVVPIDPGYAAQLKLMATTGRSNKGTLFVKAAGNDFILACNGTTQDPCLGNSNFDGDNVTPYTITVAALNAKGITSSYSSFGSNLWISSFGGEFGDTAPAMLTVDRMGCTNGYSNSGASTDFEKGASSENPDCNYTSTFNGTSSASPILSGAIALVLEANPALTWREVKYILAKTAVVANYVTGGFGHPLGLALPAGYVWEQKWITNAANFKFQNWYGFGRVDVDAAVALAKSAKTIPLALGTFTETNWAQTNNVSAAIPDNSAVGVTSVLNVPTNLTVEAVQIKVSVTHADISQLALELTSPSGTKSIIINAQNSLTGVADYISDVFLTNAFYQESSAGNWTLKVVDTKAGTTGTLTSFSINIFGGAH